MPTTTITSSSSSMSLSSSSSFTPNNKLDLFFSPDLIPAQVIAELHPSVHLRPLSSTDYHRGHLSVLSVLTHAPDQATPPGSNNMKPCVPLQTRTTPSSSSRKKRTESSGPVRSLSSANFFVEIWRMLQDDLDCSDENIPFYEKCGFEKKENEMAKYAPEAAALPKPKTTPKVKAKL
ncbi:hypothetical protein D9757_003732 [Collybiopsis confluens]|uniref:Glucosamine 6-phosphate N-acetyltransferase n=1 Tax=Collybiopsis confluens TaxID=2823264 RepID=A0A8H5HUU3_9AGAR|nr:hypothetical protein D9757_003732 [Collybiopsis confluens]